MRRDLSRILYFVYCSCRCINLLVIFRSVCTYIERCYRNWQRGLCCRVYLNVISISKQKRILESNPTEKVHHVRVMHLSRLLVLAIAVFVFIFLLYCNTSIQLTIRWLVVFVVAKVAGQRSICSIWFMRYYLFLIYLHVALILAFGQRSTIYFFFILLSSTFTAASDVHYWIEIEINGALNEARTAYRETIVT